MTARSLRFKLFLLRSSGLNFNIFAHTTIFTISCRPFPLDAGERSFPKRRKRKKKRSQPASKYNLWHLQETKYQSDLGNREFIASFIFSVSFVGSPDRLARALYIHMWIFMRFGFREYYFSNHWTFLHGILLS
ncbi:predicted protein [Methanosarcina acetivorans C2A]|uniref:Uncharacterized protein n=1 Tax=Methanosarcina acetivorans (strain ATCC 35395 / DSM 2834 / JCM 12185 / C2A) TaxID=188937 RepID=Q8TP64_METAC|nr:predicted protein [Methanosarcina acetivorans C2A]